MRLNIGLADFQKQFMLYTIPNYVVIAYQGMLYFLEILTFTVPLNFGRSV